VSSELSGVDLARQALAAAREAAKKNVGGRQEKPKRSRIQVVRRDGREPLGLGTARAGNSGSPSWWRPPLRHEASRSAAAPFGVRAAHAATRGRVRDGMHTVRKNSWVGVHTCFLDSLG
jgi:hypothetical protein